MSQSWKDYGLNYKLFLRQYNGYLSQTYNNNISLQTTTSIYYRRDLFALKMRPNAPQLFFPMLRLRHMF